MEGMKKLDRPAGASAGSVLILHLREDPDADMIERLG